MNDRFIAWEIVGGKIVDCIYCEVGFVACKFVLVRFYSNMDCRNLEITLM